MTARVQETVTGPQTHRRTEQPRQSSQKSGIICPGSLTGVSHMSGIVGARRCSGFAPLPHVLSECLASKMDEGTLRCTRSLLEVCAVLRVIDQCMTTGLWLWAYALFFPRQTVSIDTGSVPTGQKNTFVLGNLDVDTLGGVNKTQ